MISRAQRKNMLKKIMDVHAENLVNLSMIWERCAYANEKQYLTEEEREEDMMTLTRDLLINALLLSSNLITTISLQFYPDKKRGPLFKYANNFERVKIVIDDINSVYDERNQPEEEPEQDMSRYYYGLSPICFDGDILNQGSPKEYRFGKRFYEKSKHLSQYAQYIHCWYYDVEKVNKRQAHAYLSKEEMRELERIVHRFECIFKYGFPWIRDL